MPESKKMSQVLFIERIKQSLPANISLVDDIADLLGVSNDSVYRRMRGETALTIEEIALLCKNYRISFDSFIQEQDASYVNFRYNPMEQGNNDFKSYFSGMLSDINKVAQFENKRIIFAAEDVPVFQHFAFPELTSFKMFYWNKSIICADGFENKKFTLDAIDEELIEIAQSIFDKYATIPSVEIWSDDTANSTLKQIEFYWESGVFDSKETALLICDLFGKVISRIKSQAELCAKTGRDGEISSSENSYLLYQSDVMIGNNCILVEAGSIKSTYLSYHTFNTIQTTNQKFCEETDEWLQNLMKKSNLISGVAEKNRYRYFKKIEDLLAKLIETIKND